METIVAALIAIVTVIGAILVWRASVVELYVDAHLAQRGRFLVEEE